jgi:hypothetical protein
MWRFPSLNPVKRGICIDQETATWIYSLSRVANLSQNGVIKRLLQVAHGTLAPFDDAGLRRILREPWQKVWKLPALSRQMKKLSHGTLAAPTATRLTVAEKAELRRIALKNKTTMSALQRQTILQRMVSTREGFRRDNERAKEA